MGEGRLIKIELSAEGQRLSPRGRPKAASPPPDLEAIAAALLVAAVQATTPEGLAWLKENGEKEGVVTLPSGLQYKVLTQGDGARPAATDTVTVHYQGTLLDGTEFDSSYKRGEPISFARDRVIPGWTEGVQLMPVGSKYEFYIKPELGYGEGGGGPIPRYGLAGSLVVHTRVRS